MQNLEQKLILRINDIPLILTLNEGWVQVADKYEPWYWYLSLTFKNFVYQEYAIRQFKRFIRLMNEGIFGKRFRGNGKGDSKCRGVSWLNAIEWQRRGVLHFHALVGGESFKLSTPGYPPMSGYKDIWQYGLKKKSGKYKFRPNGFAKIVEYDSKKGAKYYLSKYVTKGGELDIFIPTYMYPYYGVGGEGENSFEFLDSNL